MRTEGVITVTIATPAATSMSPGVLANGARQPARIVAGLVTGQPIQRRLADNFYPGGREEVDIQKHPGAFNKIIHCLALTTERQLQW
jgi:hypothetical protein